MFEQLKKELPRAELADLSGWYRSLRRVKDAAEVRLVKRAGLLAASGARQLLPETISGAKSGFYRLPPSGRSGRAGVRITIFCSTGDKGYLDAVGDAKVKGSFAFTLTTQYMGCWAWLARTSWEDISCEEATAVSYRAIVAKVQLGSWDRQP